MKKLIYIISLILLIGCSSDDGQKNYSVPEKFDFRVEILGENTGHLVPLIIVSVNSLGVKTWEYEYLPFNEEYTYFTTGNEISNTSCNCIKIQMWAYLSAAHQMQVARLFIDGELVGSTSITPSPYPDGTVQPTVIEFVYNP